MQKKEALLFQNGSIGDFLMFVWLAEQLHTSGEFATIAIVVPRGADFLRGFLGEYPYITVLEVSRSQFLAAFRFWRQTCAQKTPVVAIIHPTPGRIPLFVKLFAWLLTRGRGSVLVGFQDAGPLCKTLYTNVLAYNTEQSYDDTVRDIVRACGVSPTPTPPRLAFVSRAGVFEKYSVQEKNYLVFHPGASVQKRSFSVAAAGACVSHMLSRSDLKVVLSGGPSERAYLEEIVATVPDDERGRVVLAVGASAQDVSTLLVGAKLFIGTDTGITHLTCFLGTKTIVAAHHGTANWLPFYAPNATVLYRFAEDTEAHKGIEYLEARRGGRLKPFADVPTPAILEAIVTEL
ncbi:MAG: glycosyltransferase family 9 protein [bacterium]